jgi:hypothetical protein
MKLSRYFGAREASTVAAGIRSFMHSDKRKSARRPIRYSAWVVFGRGSRQRCVVHDVSVGGARIEFKAVDELPRELPAAFMLMLDGQGQSSRWCRVVWRANHQIGVQFKTMSRAEAARVLLQKQPDVIAADR